jgi:N-acyl-D-amino-acid deacylase
VKWDTDKIGTNAALLVGFGSVRRALLGSSDAAPTAPQLDSMRALVRRSMERGALGLSTGLYYAPQSFAATAEVVAVARTIAPFGGVYDSHLRDESSYTIGLLGAVREAIAIGREAGVAVNISHIKALGVDVWGNADSVIALIAAARSAGQRGSADQYPYLASGSSVGASLLPRWAEAGGEDSLQKRIGDPATRARLVTDMTENLRRRGGAASLLITGGAAELRGKTLEQLAQSKGVSPIDMALEIITGGGASVASFNMNETDIETFMRQPFVMTGSDGSGGHPRKYGTYPLVFRRYVFEKKVLTLEQAVKRSSSQVAEVFGIADRGVVRRGAFADVVVIDTAQYRDRSTYQDAQLLATGVRHVFVNGTLAVENGSATEAMAGRALRRSRGTSSGASRPGVDGDR